MRYRRSPRDVSFIQALAGLAITGVALIAGVVAVVSLVAPPFRFSMEAANAVQDARLNVLEGAPIWNSSLELCAGGAPADMDILRWNDSAICWRAAVLPPDVDVVNRLCPNETLATGDLVVYDAAGACYLAIPPATDPVNMCAGDVPTPGQVLRYDGGAACYRSVPSLGLLESWMCALPIPLDAVFAWNGTCLEAFPLANLDQRAAVAELEGALANATLWLNGRVAATEANLTALEGRVSASEGDIAALEGRVSAAEGNITALDGRLSTTEGDVAALDGRVSAAEGNLTALDGRLALGEADILELDARLTGLEANYTAQNEADITALNGRVGGLEGNLTVLDGRVDGVEADLGSLESNLTTLGGRVSAAELDIGSLESNLTALDGRVAESEADIGNLESNLTALEGRVAANEADVGSLESNLTALDGRVADAETAIGALESNLTALDGRVSAAEADVGALESNLTALDGRVGTNEADIATLQADVGTAQSDITTLQADVAALAGRPVTRAFQATSAGAVPSSYATVVFDTSQFARGIGWDTIASRFVAPADGYYRISTSVSISSGTAFTASVRARLDGLTYAQLAFVTNMLYANLQGNTVVGMSTGQVLTIEAESSSGGYGGGGSTETWVEVESLG